MKMNAKIAQILLIIEVAIIMFNTVIAQSQPGDFTIPAGWEVTENWLPKFQQAFGTDTNYNNFFSIMSESDFLLTHPEHQAFIFVWQEVADSKSNRYQRASWDRETTLSFAAKRSNIEETNPVVSIKGPNSHLSIQSKQITVNYPAKRTKINVLLLAPKKHHPDVYHSNLPLEIAQSWRNIPVQIITTNQGCTLTACSANNLR
jgi:hypothetical protein